MSATQRLMAELMVTMAYKAAKADHQILNISKDGLEVRIVFRDHEVGHDFAKAVSRYRALMRSES